MATNLLANLIATYQSSDMGNYKWREKIQEETLNCNFHDFYITHQRGYIKHLGLFERQVYYSQTIKVAKSQYSILI
jgi:ABC-type transport system involved in cytochrome c biogenesis ATPase subunit